MSSSPRRSPTTSRSRRLARLWVDNGDIAALLNDADAYKALGGLPRERPTESLLSGSYMLFHLLDALGGVSATNPKPAPSPYADQIDLWVTSTDLSGRPEEIGLSDQGPLEQEREVNHRARFHFVYDAGGDGEPINMFGREYDPLLAFVARATSSFPGAFRPVQLRDVNAVAAKLRAAFATGRSRDSVAPDRLRAGATLVPAVRRARVLRERLVRRRRLPRQQAGGPRDGDAAEAARRSPGEPARARRGSEPRRRRGRAHDTRMRRAPTCVSTLLKVVTLPRVQTIGGEIDRIKALSGPLETRERIYDAVEAALTGGAGPVDSPARAGYLALRTGDTIADLAAALARVGFGDRAYEVDSAQYELARTIVTAWLDGASATTRSAFLGRLDLAYFLRRVNYVNHRGGVPPATLAADGRRPAAPDPTRPGAALTRDGDRRACPRCGAPWTRSPPPVRARSIPRGPEFVAAVQAVEPVMQAFAAALDLDGATQRGRGDRQHARRESRRNGGTASTRVDEATLALRQLIPGENKDIAVVRVSPRDATSVCDERHGQVKLAGTAIHHFGGFFRPDWRRNDIMWGRLDAAERLIGMLVDDAADATIDKAAFVRDAHEAIITDLLADANYRSLFDVIAPGSMTAALTDPADYPSASVRVLDCLKSEYKLPPGPTREDTLSLASRSARVVDGMTAGLADDTASTDGEGFGRGCRRSSVPPPSSPTWCSTAASRPR